MNNTTAVELVMTSNVTSVITTFVTNVTNHTSDAFRVIPMTIFAYLSLAVFKLYNSLF
jgi:hypothetical protein